MSITKDGRLIDTLENYRWPFLVGGPADGQRVPSEKSWRLEEFEVDGETYLRRRVLMTGAPARIGYFLAKELPEEAYGPYAVHRRILDTHPELVRLPDIKVESKGAKR